jgi:hypothetical protein
MHAICLSIPFSLTSDDDDDDVDKVTSKGSTPYSALPRHLFPSGSSILLITLFLIILTLFSKPFL